MRRIIRHRMLILGMCATVLSLSLYAKSDTTTLSNEELQTIYRVFLYDNQPQKAYETAQRAVRRFPHDTAWLEKLAQAAMWSDHPKEALEAMLRLYRRNPSPKMEERIIKMGLEYYRYEELMPVVKRRMFRDPNRTTIDRFVYVYTQAGEPIEAADTLMQLYRTHRNSEALRQALGIYLQAGEMDLVKRAIDAAQADRKTMEAIAPLRAYYAFTTHRIDEALASLMQVWQRKRNDPNYLRQVSDLAWYLGEFETARRASQRLIALHQGRQSDYERIVASGSDIDASVAWEAWRRFGDASMLYIAMETYAKEGRYAVIYRRLRPYIGKRFQNDPSLYLLFVEAATRVHREREARRVLDRLYRRYGNDPEVVGALLWHAIDADDQAYLRRLLKRVSRQSLADSVALPLATGYFQLQEIDRAATTIRRYLRFHTQSVEGWLMLGYLMQARHDETAASSAMRRAYTILQRQSHNDPIVRHDPAWLDRMMQAAMFVEGAQRFEARLQEAAALLPQQRMNELRTLWTLRNNADEQARRLSRKLRKPETWLRLALAMRFDDRGSIRRLLYTRGLLLSYQERAEAFEHIDDDGRAYAAAFEGSERSRFDPILPQTMRRLMRRNAARVDTKATYLRRDRVDAFSNVTALRWYPSNGWTMRLTGTWTHFSADASGTIVRYPHDRNVWRFGVSKRWQRATVDMAVGYADTEHDYSTATASIRYDWSDRVTLQTQLDLGKEADETTYLWLGGYKHRWKTAWQYRIVPSMQMSVGFDAARYYAQEGTYVGYGYLVEGELSKTWRSGYPDMTTSLFVHYGKYTQTRGDFGSLASMGIEANAAVLPKDFTTIGVRASYGMQSREQERKGWLPYVSVAPSYNSAIHALGVTFNGGIGRSFFGRDRLDVGVMYDSAFNGTNDTAWSVALTYRFYW